MEAGRPKPTANFVNIIAVISILLGFLYIFLITFIEIPEGSQRFADTALGVVISMILSTVYNFIFGSSRGSNEKQKIIETSIKTPTQND